MAILTLHARGKTPTQISRDIGCSRSMVYDTIRRLLRPPKTKMPKTVRTDELTEAVSEAVNDARGKATAEGLAQKFKKFI